MFDLILSHLALHIYHVFTAVKSIVEYVTACTLSFESIHFQYKYGSVNSFKLDHMVYTDTNFYNLAGAQTVNICQ